MSDQNNFLTRWSRRKREAADENAQPERPVTEAAAKPAAPGEETNQTIAARAPEANAPPAPEFDLTKLPTIESIGANSDIRAFLQAGVPSALRNAALRRAWVADPAIRDFVGLAENAWDFTDPAAMPGFGELDPHYDIKKLVAEIFREAEAETESLADSTIPAPAPEQPARLSDQSATAADVPAASESATAEPQQSAAAANRDALLQRDENIATQHDDSRKEPAAAKARRHGSAMPQ
jgi:hypothetical protein